MERRILISLYYICILKKWIDEIFPLYSWIVNEYNETYNGFTYGKNKTKSILLKFQKKAWYLFWRLGLFYFIPIF